MSLKSKIYVGNLAWKATQEDLYEIFDKFGPIVEVSIISERGRSKGYGFVTFESSRDAEDAIRGADGVEIMARPIEVAKANPRPSGGGLRDGDRGGRSGGYGGGRSRRDSGGYSGSYGRGGGRRNDSYGGGRSYGGRSYDRNNRY